MSSVNFKSFAVALAFVLFASAAVPNKRSIQWLQQNGPAAKALNDQYSSLTVDSSCNNDGDIACIGTQFATCWQGRYITTNCPDGWSCAAIPNEWSEGTSTTCDTNDNIAWRFAQAGISEFKRSSPPETRSIQWLQKNGPAAKALNDQYKSLTVDSPCSGDVACIGEQFATCYDGKYVTWSCPGSLTCAAIPNEWSDGTTTICDSVDNIAWRFSQAGVSEF